MLVKYLFGIVVDMRNIYQFRNFFMKYKPLVTNNKDLFIEHLIRSLFQIQFAV